LIVVLGSKRTARSALLEAHCSKSPSQNAHTASLRPHFPKRGTRLRFTAALSHRNAHSRQAGILVRNVAEAVVLLHPLRDGASEGVVEIFSGDTAAAIQLAGSDGN